MDIITEIISWAESKLDYWEQYLLCEILSGRKLDETTLQKAEQYLCEQAALQKKSDWPNLQYPANVKDDRPKGFLTQISGTKHINRLADDQQMEFSPSLTVCFGENGSGKSGYARVLGCAGISNGDKTVLPDVTDETCYLEQPTLNIHYQEHSGVSHQISYDCSTPAAELSWIRAFDSMSVKSHLGMNDFILEPAGLGCLSKLAELTDQVREKCKSRIKEYRADKQFGSRFDTGPNDVTTFVNGISANSNLREIGQTARLSKTQAKRLDELPGKITDLQKGNHTKIIKELGDSISAVQSFYDALVLTRDSLLQVAPTCRHALALVSEAEDAAKAVGIEQFQTDYFKSVGSVAWQKFIHAAHEVAIAESNDEKYPRPDDKCILCNQPLSLEASERMTLLWSFIQGEAQNRLKAFNQALGELKTYIENTVIPTFDDTTVAYQVLKKRLPDEIDPIKGFLASCSTTKEQALSILENEEVSSHETANFPAQLNDLIQSLTDEKEQLEKTDTDKLLTEMKNELALLKNKSILKTLRRDVFKHVVGLRAANRLEQNLGSTGKITRQSGKLFDDLVAKGYVDRFKRYLACFDPNLMVDVKYKGRKIDGKIFKARELHISNLSKSAKADKVRTEQILSEGEKRAVTIADFIAEAMLDDSCCCIVYDDPVTSLDHNWKENMAYALAEQALHKQVVVFTHDLPFLAELFQAVEEVGVDMRNHWIEGRSKPGLVFNDNSPGYVEDYYNNTKPVDEWIDKAENAPPAEHEHYVRSGFAALRSCYEWLIIKRILGGVVKRFKVQIVPSALKEVVCPPEIAKQVIDKHHEISAFIEGHLPSSEYQAIPAKLDRLLEEKREFERISGDINKLRKDRREAFAQLS